MSKRECTKCHRSWPDTPEFFIPRHRQCRACRREYQYRWAKNNPEKVREARRRWRENNPEDPEKHRIRATIWRKNNLERKREYVRRYRAHKRNGQTKTDVTAAKIVDLKRRSKGKCYWCHRPAKPIHIDHIMPLSKGGEHMMFNLVVSCARCNEKKHARMPQEMGVLL